MAQINPLTQLKKGESPKSVPINSNFETLRLANNALVSRIEKLNLRIETPPAYNAEIETLNLFGIVGGTTYDNNKLSADRLNENFDKFKIALLATGGIPNVRGNLDYLQTTMPELPTPPSGLEIAGVLIDENGDRQISLTWTGGSGETGYQVYQSTVEMVNVTNFKLKFSPQDAILVDLPIQGAESTIINLGQAFLNPLPETTQVGDPIPADNNELKGKDVNFWIRACNLVGYSNWSNKVYTGAWNVLPTAFEPRVYNVVPSIDGSNLIIDFNQYVTNAINPRLGYEVYISYAPSQLSGLERFDLYPYTLLYKHESNIEGTIGQITVTGYNPPSPVYDEYGTHLNKYMLIKVVAYNALQRSLISIEDTGDRGACETPMPLYALLGYGVDTYKLYPDNTLEAFADIIAERITKDDNYIYVTNGTVVSKLNKTDLTEVTSIDTGHVPLRIDTDGTYFYEYALSRFYKRDCSDLSLVSTFPSLLVGASSITTDGTYLYACTGTTLRKYSCDDWSLVDSTAIGGIDSMVANGDYIYAVNNTLGMLYKLNCSDLSTVSSVEGVISHSGICLNYGYLYTLNMDEELGYTVLMRYLADNLLYTDNSGESLSVIGDYLTIIGNR